MSEALEFSAKFIFLGIIDMITFAPLVSLLTAKNFNDDFVQDNRESYTLV